MVKRRGYKTGDDQLQNAEPEKDGLFCERIFGPSKDWSVTAVSIRRSATKAWSATAAALKLQSQAYAVSVWGISPLAAPVSHIWYFKGIPSRMGLILDISPRTLERVLYFASYIVLDKGETDLQNKQILSEAEYQEQKDKWGSGAFRVGMGAEAIKELLEAIDLEKECAELQGCAGEFHRPEARKDREETGSRRGISLSPATVRSGWSLTAIPVIPPESASDGTAGRRTFSQRLT